MDRWAGRTALVTGAGSGIGRATAAELLRCGVNVVACDLVARVALVEAIAEEVTDAGRGQLMAFACDVSKEEDILAMFEAVRRSGLQGVDICVNSAGIASNQPLSEGETHKWRKMLEVNVLGLSICTREALKSMRARGVDDGHVIHMSSVTGHTAWAPAPIYSATKFAVRALAEGLRQELAQERSGIRVTVLSPGYVKTGFIENFEGERFRALYDNRPYLTAADIVAAMVHALSAPRHVQVHEVVIRSVAMPE